MVEALHWLIPNTPQIVKDQIERESLLKQDALWQIDSSLLKSLRQQQDGIRTGNSSAELGNVRRSGALYSRFESVEEYDNEENMEFKEDYE